MATMRSDDQEPGGPVADGDGRTWEDIAWIEIQANGEESQETGQIWGEGPSLAGMSTWWVLPDAPDGEPGGAREPVRLVARASRRHQVGREVLGHWWAAQGRYVDVGEYFRESDPRSRFQVRCTPPTHVRPRKRVDVVEQDLWAQVCERAERDNAIERANDEARGATFEFDAERVWQGRHAE